MMREYIFDEWETIGEDIKYHKNKPNTFAGGYLTALTNLWYTPPNKVERGPHEGYNQSTSELLDKDPTVIQEIIDNGFTDSNGNIKWVSYAHNNYGFRSDSWLDGVKGAIFLGCSDTYGVGNYLEDIWPYKVAKHLGVKMFNLGYPGGGVDQAYRVLKTHISSMNAEYVCMLTPEITRREIFHNGKPLLLSVNALNSHLKEDFKNEKKLLKELESVYTKIYLQHHNALVNSSASLDGIRYLCGKYGKKFIEFKNPFYYPESYTDEFVHRYHKNPSKALDLKHRGRTFQDLIAKYFIEKL